MKCLKLPYLKGLLDFCIQSYTINLKLYTNVYNWKGIKMEKKVLSIRVSETTQDKLAQLLYMENENEKKYKTPAMTKSEIVEEAISEYFAMKLDKETGTDYLTRMNLMIQDAINSQNKITVLQNNAIMRYALSAYEASLTILKYLRLDDKNIKDDENINILVNQAQSIFEKPIEEKVESLLINGKKNENL